MLRGRVSELEQEREGLMDEMWRLTQAIEAMAATEAGVGAKAGAGAGGYANEVEDEHSHVRSGGTAGSAADSEPQIEDSRPGR